MNNLFNGTKEIQEIKKFYLQDINQEDFYWNISRKDFNLIILDDPISAEYIKNKQKFPVGTILYYFDYSYRENEYFKVIKLKQKTMTLAKLVKKTVKTNFFTGGKFCLPTKNVEKYRNFLDYNNRFYCVYDQENELHIKDDNFYKWHKLKCWLVGREIIHPNSKPSTCRYCLSNFSSRNKLFIHLNLYKNHKINKKN